MLNVLLMRRDGESLADFVKRTRLAKGLSVNDVADRSGYGKTGISNAYVSKIENGISTNPSRKKLLALAKGLDIPSRQLRRIVDATDTEEDEDFVSEALKFLDGKYKTADDETRRMIDEVAQMLAEKAAQNERSRLHG